MSAVAAACGGSSQVAQTGSGIATDKPEAHEPTGPATVAKRDADVPESRDENEVIVYLRAGSVWMMTSDSEEPVQLSVRDHDRADGRPAIAPDGTRIAYAAPVENSYRIHVLSLEEMIPRAVSAGPDTEPAWSPDGERLAFVRGVAPEQRDLVVLDLATGTERVLIEGDDDHPELVGGPVWSPDGRSLVFSADRRNGEGTLLWRVDAARGRLTRLTEPRPRAWFVRDLEPAFSPDGETIAFASNRHVASGDAAEDYDIYTIGADGSGLTRLTEDPGAATDPAFSPDGRRIVFVSDRDKQNAYETELYVMAASGGVQRRMTRDERPQNRAPHLGRSR